MHTETRDGGNLGARCSEGVPEHYLESRGLLIKEAKKGGTAKVSLSSL